MMLSACIEWLFKAEHEDFCDRIRAARDAGLGGVEFHMWRNKPLDEIERTLAETGLALTSLLVEPRVQLVDPGAQEAVLTAIHESLPIARRLKSPALVVASGPLVQGATREAQHASMVSILKAAAPIVEDAGITLLLEPVNTLVDHPGVYLDRTPEGLDVIEEVGSPRVRLLYDMYHSTAMGEAPEQVLGARMHLVAHVQVADSPGRHEPGSGAIDWKHYLGVLHAKGYTGAIGLEYRPSGDTLASLQLARRSLGL
jgi:hydroxypyruvate isomerase